MKLIFIVSAIIWAASPSQAQIDPTASRIGGLKVQSVYSNPAFFRKFILQINPVDNALGVSKFEAVWYKQITACTCFISVDIKTGANTFEPTVVSNVPFDLCVIMKNYPLFVTSTAPISYLFPDFVPAMYDLGLVRPCPFQPDRAKGSRVISGLYLPAVFPQNDGRLSIECKQGNTRLIKVVLAYDKVTRPI